MDIITIHKGNIDSEHICCAIGNDRQNQSRAQAKKDWLKARFEEGLVFKRLDVRGKVFVEYMPVEKVWKPIIGKNWAIINCLWVSGQFKGQGWSKRLLNACIEDAQAQKMDGVAVVTSTKVKPFLTDRKFYLRHGFQTVDAAYPYFELLALKFKPSAENPCFADHAKNGTTTPREGVVIIFSNQCPFAEEYAGFYADVVKKHRLPCHVIKLKTYTEAQQLGSPFGTFGVYFNGKFQMHELPTVARFEKWVMKMKPEEWRRFDKF